MAIIGAILLIIYNFLNGIEGGRDQLPKPGRGTLLTCPLM